VPCDNALKLTVVPAIQEMTGMGFSITVAAIIYQGVLYSSLNLLHVIYMSIDCDIPYVIQW
jgi:hypothetical protein